MTHIFRPTASDFLRILMSAEKCPDSNSRKRKAQNVKNSVDHRNESESAVLGCSRPDLTGICEKKARKETEPLIKRSLNAIVPLIRSYFFRNNNIRGANRIHS